MENIVLTPLTYRLIRSERKTLALEIGPEGLIVRAPRLAPKEDVERFVESHAPWIRSHMQKLEERLSSHALEPKLSAEDLLQLAQQAKKVIPERVQYFAPMIGVSYGRITIRNQRSKWGSCSSKGNLNFNCLLMLAPPEVLDSVVVHELCHRKEMNHSKRFYEEVRRVFPEYDRWNRWLKDNGPALLQRMTY